MASSGRDGQRRRVVRLGRGGVAGLVEEPSRGSRARRRAPGRARAPGDRLRWPHPASPARARSPTRTSRRPKTRFRSSCASRKARRTIGATFFARSATPKSKRIWPDSGCQRRGAVLDDDAAALHRDAHSGQRPALRKLLAQAAAGPCGCAAEPRAADVSPRAVRRNTRSGKEKTSRPPASAVGREKAGAHVAANLRLGKPEEPGDFRGRVALQRSESTPCGPPPYAAGRPGPAPAWRACGPGTPSELAAFRA